MECIVPGNNMKVLGKALQALSKIGDELYVEAGKERLSLITLNSSKTVCARFSFLDSFFSCYDVNEGAPITCKIHLKVFLPLFRGNLEKKLDYLKVEYEQDDDFIIFKMKYKFDDILMVHRLRLMDNETLAIGISVDSGANNIAASSNFYNQLLSMFSNSDDEITFEITGSKVVVRNYCVGTPCRPKMTRSQINLNPTEFLLYNITKPTTVNFSLKPLRTVIHFADAFNLNIDFNFETGGKPLSMILKSPTFEVNFMVATLNPYSDTNSSVASRVQVDKPNELLTEEDVAALESENWENDKEVSVANSLKSGKENVEIVPSSPESPRTKKARTVFGRCYDATFHETILGEILAADSDTD